MNDVKSHLDLRLGAESAGTDQAESRPWRGRLHMLLVHTRSLDLVGRGRYASWMLGPASRRRDLANSLLAVHLRHLRVCIDCVHVLCLVSPLSAETKLNSGISI